MSYTLEQQEAILSDACTKMEQAYELMWQVWRSSFLHSEDKEELESLATQIHSNVISHLINQRDRLQAEIYRKNRKR